jgi:hypothetical protein
MHVGDIVEIPFDKTEIILEEYKVYFGAKQDRTTDKLFAITNDSKDDHLITFIRIEDSKFMIAQMDRYSNYFLSTADFEGFFQLNTKFRFVEGYTHFYYEKGNLYNKNHQPFAEVSFLLMRRLVEYSELYPISDRCCLLLQPKIRVYLFWEEEIVVLQSHKRDILYPNTILLGDLLLQNFTIDQELVLRLSRLSSLEEVISYLKKEMMFCVI